MASNGEPSVFDLAAVPEPGPRRSTETRWQWLERSSEPVAAETRARWGRWLRMLPGESRTSILSRFKSSDEQQEAALAELVSFVLLRSVYPDVEVDPATGSGSHTDFAVGGGGRTHIEVRRVTMSENAVKDARRRRDVAEALERIDSPDFWLALEVELGPRLPSMRQARRDAAAWLVSLDYETERDRLEQYQRGHREGQDDDQMPGLDSSPQERARYFAARAPFEPASFNRSGEDWSLRIEAVPRAPDRRGTSEITIGVRLAGEAHVAAPDVLQQAVRDKLRQHDGLTAPLVVVLDLSSPIVDDDEIVAELYGPMARSVGSDGVPILTRDRSKGIWPEPPMALPRLAAVLILRGVELRVREATAKLWLPPGADSPIAPGPWSVRTIRPDGRPGLLAAPTVTITDCLS